MTWHAAKTLRKGFRIAVHTARANLGAAAHGVPRRVGPLDLGFIAHNSNFDLYVTAVSNSELLAFQTTILIRV